MKKKIALLLAVIMTLSLMPMTVFAGSSNYLAKGTLSLKKDTRYDGSSARPVTAGEKIANGLVIEFKDEIPYDVVGQKFRIELTNAEFSNLSDASAGPISIFTYPAANFATSTAITGKWDTTDGGIVPSNSATVEASAVVEGVGNVATVTVNKAKANDKMTILLPLKTVNTDDVDVSVAITANNSFVSVGTYLISRTAGTSTTTSAKDIATGRDLIELENIIIKENFIGSFKAMNVRNAIELVAPSGYEFVKEGLVTAVGTGEHSLVNQAGGTYAPKLERDGTSLIIALTPSGNAKSSILPESIIIGGVWIQPIDQDNIPYGNTLSMSIYKYDGYSKIAAPNDYVQLDGLSEQSFDVAKAVDWTVSVTAATATDVVTGRLDAREDVTGQTAAKVTFKELETGAWISQRTTDFVLPEGVTIRGVKFNTFDKMDPSGTTMSSSIQVPPTANASDLLKDKWTLTVPALFGGSATVDKNVLSLKNFTVQSGQKAKIEFTLYLSISPEFEGSAVTLTTTGTAIQQEVPDVTIANVIKPITVSAKVTDVQIGFQRYAVGDIVIKENKAGAILRTSTSGAKDAGLVVGISDFITSTADITLVPVTASQVSVDGDLKVTLNKTTDGTINFDVDRLSTKPSTITIKGVEIKINRTVPYGVYDLVVSGESVYANKYQYSAVGALVKTTSRFDAYGYTAPYINVATEGMNSPLKANVKIAKDSDIVLVDGVQQKMMYPTYFDVEQSSFLVPARFISQIFGVEDNNIFWNDSTKTVSIITANRTLQFTAGSDVMVVAANGAPSNVTMTAKAILHPVTERLYVPFRAIGEAFGVPVAYDEATQMGIYNPVK